MHAQVAGRGKVERALMQKHLDALAGALPGVRTAVVASVDGFAVAQSRGSGGSEERLAAMTSSMLALASAVGRELGMGPLQALMLEAEDGKVLMLSVETGGEPLLLMVACTQRSVMGTVLWTARECAREIAATLSAS